MRKMFKVVFAILIATTLSVSLFAQKSFFTEVTETQGLKRSANRVIVPQKYKTLAIDKTNLAVFLKTLPSEANRGQAPVMELPMPDGKMAKFHVWESSVMEPALAAKYPEIKTYSGQGIDDPYATARFDYNPYFGFSAQILSVNGNVYIDPYAKGNISYNISYYIKDYSKTGFFVCGTDTDPVLPGNDMAKEQAGPCRGTELYTFRLALACTGEYATRVCLPAAPTVAATLAAMTTSVNRVVGVYEKEIAVRLVLVANTDQLIYLDGTTDPYTNNDGTTMLTQNQSNVDLVIGSANYDIGHVFSTAGGGIAGLGVICGPSKARGVTGQSNPTGDGFDIDFVAHEMGHQFGASHTFNSVSGNCGGNRSSSSAYEVGSGTTIMGYAGICGSDDIQPHSDAFFHTRSYDQISTFLQGTAVLCAQVTNTGNTLPQITVMSNNNVTIPVSTPFTLSATASDANSDALTYCWEEWDLGTQGAWNSGANSTTAPLFKSRPPKTTGSRTFPDISLIRDNNQLDLQDELGNVMGGNKGETLPMVARTMKFRLTVRDNRAGGGGVVTGGDGCQAAFIGIFQVNVDGTTPFTVTAPNTPVTYPGGTSQTVTWDVAATNAAPFNVSNVKISLSTDGGLTYPTVLLASTPNDGSQAVMLPANPATITTCRIKVEADPSQNVFFDISNTNFTITAAAVGFSFNNPAPATAACPPPSSMSITLGTAAIGAFSNPITLSATSLLPTGTTVTFGTNPVTPGNSSTVTLNNTGTLASGSYIVTISGTATGAATQTRDLTFTVNAGTGPAISAHPQPQTVCAGNDATFSVTSAAGISYQWQVNTGSGFTNISGATLASYTANGVTAAQNGHQYRVLVNGQCGQTTSGTALLTVQTAPAISAQPQNATVCLGSNATFNATASGTGITYQWQINTGSGFTDIASATSASYTQTSTTLAMNNYQYRVVITGTCLPVLNSNAATLTVISPVTVTAQPQNFTICETGTATFTVAGSGTGVLYQWQVSTDGGNNYTNINGETGATLTLNGVTASMNNNRYRAQLRNATCTTPVSTVGGILTVNARPTVTLSAAPFTELLPGQTTTITAAIVPSAAGFNITWYRNDVELPGITGTAYVADVTGIGTYKVKIVNQTTGCNNESAVLAITATQSERLFVFPSPNDGQFKVAYYNSAGSGTQQTITVYDAHGAQVYLAKMPVTGQYTLHNINLTGKATGVYIVVVGDATGKKLAQEKVVIH